MYPVRICGGKAIASKKLKTKSSYPINSIGEPVLNENSEWVHDITYSILFLDEKDHFDNSDLWIALELSLENYEPDLSWASFIGYNNYSDIVKYIERVSELVSETEITIIKEYILCRPEVGWLKYIEDLILLSGVRGIIDSIISTSHSHLCYIINDAMDSNPFKTSRVCKYSFLDVINRYNHEIDGAYCVDSLAEKFLIKTNGFNQCFTHLGESYSSVAVKRVQHVEKEMYAVYIYGCDDSSYTRIVDSISKANFLALALTKISPVIYKRHLEILKFEFTN